MGLIVLIRAITCKLGMEWRYVQIGGVYDNIRKTF